MAAFIKPIINGGGSITTQQGRTDTLVVYVEDLTLGTDDATAAGIMDEANSALIAAGLWWGTIHPFNGSMVCSQVKIDPFGDSRTQVKATLTYVQLSVFPLLSKVVRFRAWSERIMTSRYSDRSLILVNYTGADGTVFPPQLGSVPGTKAMGKLIIEQTMSVDPEPLLVCENKLNAGTYRGQAEGSFLCTAVNIDPNGDGLWRVVFEADYDEHKHVQEVMYKNPQTGQPYVDIIGGVDSSGNVIVGSYNPDVAEGNGFVNAQVQDLIDFAAFGF